MSNVSIVIECKNQIIRIRIFWEDSQPKWPIQGPVSQRVAINCTMQGRQQVGDRGDIISFVPPTFFDQTHYWKHEKLLCFNNIIHLAWFLLHSWWQIFKKSLPWEGGQPSSHTLPLDQLGRFAPSLSVPPTFQKLLTPLVRWVSGADPGFSCRGGGGTQRVMRSAVHKFKFSLLISSKHKGLQKNYKWTKETW